MTAANTAARVLAKQLTAALVHDAQQPSRGKGIHGPSVSQWLRMMACALVQTTQDGTLRMAATAFMEQYDTADAFHRPGDLAIVAGDLRAVLIPQMGDVPNSRNDTP